MFFTHFERLLESTPWLFGLALMLLVLPVLTVVGAVGVSFFTSLSGRAGGKVFADKLAKQVAQFGVIILGLWLMLISARWGLWALSWWPAGVVGQGFYPLFFDVPGHMALAASLSLIVLARFWKRGKRVSGAHLALGGVSLVLWLATLAAFLGGVFWRLGGNVPPGTRLTMDALTSMVGCPMPWLIWGGSFFLALSLGAGIALLYLVARRNREDYGRDYYVWGVRRCAWWAIIAGVMLAGWTKAVFWRGVVAGSDRTTLSGVDWVSDTITAMVGHPVMPTLTISLCLALLSWLCLVPVLKSQTPLRMKGWMLLHALLAVSSLTALCRMYGELLG
ncbi:MAG TPA: hypothetical protein ENN39_08745 [Desulfonatronum sp.]|nr:hypothetical protein [Desulfonatronum sp.]